MNMNKKFNANNEGLNKTNSLNKKPNIKNSIFKRKEVAKLIAALFIVSVPSISFAKGGVYINDGTDRGCSYIYDTAEGIQRGTFDECTNPSTNTTRSLFFGPTGTGVDDDNASKSLSLGGNLMVNGGGVQLTDLNDKSYSMRIGSNSTMSAKGGKNSIAIGSAQNGSDIGKATTASANQSIAIGSSTESSSENAVAIGTQSVAKAKNSVALGAGSVADTQNTVSVGSSGNERKIVNVADAKLSNTSTDAVNGSQLFATNSNVTDNANAIQTNKQNIASNTNDIATNKDNIQINTDEIAKNKANITTNTTDIATNKADITTTSDNLTNLTNNINEGKVGLVQQDDASKNITVATNTGGSFVNLKGSDGDRTLSGVQKGTIAQDSTEAINGSQLFDTNSKVETNTQDIATNKDNIDANTKDIATNRDNISTNTKDIATNRDNISTNTKDIEANKTNITNNTNSINDLTTNINNGQVGLVKQDATSKEITVASETGGDTVNLTGTDGERKLTGLKEGELKEDGTDAVNAGQLFDTNSKVTANTNNIETNTKDIATNRDNIATNTKDIETNRIDINNNTNSINDLTTNINSGQVGLVKQDPNTNYITVASNSGGSYVSFRGSEGNRTLTDIKDGELKEGSSDAVTGSQLFETNTKVEANSNNIATNTKDIETNRDNIAKNTDNITTNTNNIATNTKDIETNRDNITTNTNNIAKNTESITTLTNNINSGQVGLVRQDADTKEINVSTDTGGTSVNFKGTDGDRTLTGVKGGNIAKDSTDAVNGGQLFETNAKVEANTNDIAKNTSNIEKLTNDVNSGQVGLVKQDADSKEITIASETGGSSVSLKGADGDRSLTGVKGGNIAKDSTDVVNGNQLFETNSKVETNTKDIATSKSQIESNTTAINTNKEDIKRLSSDIDNASVMKLSEDGSKLTLNDKAKGAENIDFAEKRVTGIGQAKNDTDAVNLSQAKSLNEQTLTSSKTYTDKRVTNLENYVSNETGRLDGRINDLDEKVNKGLASSAALNGLFQPYGVGKMNITAGVGGYSNKSAVAVGAGYRFNETVAIKGGVATTSGNGSSTMYNASVNFEW